MRILSAADVRLALPMAEAIEAMKRAFAALSAGQVEAPLRAHLPIADHDGTCLVMPAYVRDEQGEALAVKVVSLFAANAARGLARIQAAVLAIDPQTGRPLALLEGSTLTAIRTAAASGAATDLLARPDSRTVAVLGAGVQGRAQLQAVCAVRKIRTAWVYDPAPEQVRSFVTELKRQGLAPADVRPARDVREALADADIVCLATTARRPVFADADLKAGAHLNAIGSYQPDVREVPPETVLRALVVVDSREAALAEAGDLIQPIRDGLITPRHVHAELGELVLRRRTGRTSPDQLTLFKSVGLAVQDAVAAAAALRQAEQLGLGTQAAW